MARIRTQCSQNRVRLAEFMRDFDKLRSGFVSAAQFRIALNIGKIQISNGEFKMLCDHFKAPKDGEHVCWKVFCDEVDQVFTKKGLEQNVDIVLGDARTATNYGRLQASEEEQACVAEIVAQFTEVVRKNRLDAKSFFQDFDRMRHFKVSPKIFRQVLTTHGFPLSEEQVRKVSLVYGDQNYDIRYADFLADSNVLTMTINGPSTGVKSTYSAKFTDFDGSKEMENLMNKIKECVKRHRIRILEYFQDHDLLRKGHVQPTKFRSVLYNQQVQLTSHEYGLLEKHYAVDNSANAPLVDYVRFSEEIDGIFTQKDLEKNPTKTLARFEAPSILMNKSALSEAECEQLHQLMERLGTHVRNHRLLIKPFFQDKDRSSSGFVNMTRFRQIMDNMKLRASDADFALLNKRFMAKASNEINYVEFDWVLRHYSGDLQE